MDVSARAVFREARALFWLASPNHRYVYGHSASKDLVTLPLSRRNKHGLICWPNTQGHADPEGILKTSSSAHRPPLPRTWG
jgi:hypothetical protein